MLHIKRIALIVALILLSAAFSGCKKFQTAPENSDFLVDCVIGDGNVSDGARMTLILSAQTTAGECTLSFSLKEKATGASVVDYALLLDGHTRIGASDIWSFNEFGTAFFVIKGVPEGEYIAEASVKRWFHTATATAEFDVTL